MNSTFSILDWALWNIIIFILPSFILGKNKKGPNLQRSVFT